MTSLSNATPIASAASFVNSIGVDTKASYPAYGSYDNASLMIDSLRYLGITALRDGYTTNPAAAPVVDALAAAGYKFDFVVSSSLPATGSAGLQQYIDGLDAFEAANPGSVSAVEGLNEANLFPFSYNGSSSMAAAGQFQAALYDAVKNDPALQSVQVYNMTLGYSDPAVFASLGNLADSADDSNSHAYAPTGTSPAKAIAAAIALASTTAVGKPSVITETGYTTYQNHYVLGVDQGVQAKSILNTLVDAFKDGVSQTYLYELLDHPASSAIQQHFGLFNSDGTPKLAATAIHNLTTILSDDGTGGDQPTVPLSYQLQGMPATGNSMVLGKSDGAYDLVVWAEPRIYTSRTDTDITNPVEQVNVHLGSVHRSVSVYDPMSGSAPIATYSNVQDFTIPVCDHPLIVEIDAPAPSVSSAPTPAPITTTAAGLVAQISTLAADGGFSSITLTDTNTLAVASQDTMNYMISHYQSVLQAIQGGYSFSVTNSTPTWTKTFTYDATGTQTSEIQSDYTNGVIKDSLVTYADGSTVSTGYTNGIKTIATVTNADSSVVQTFYGITGQFYVTRVKSFDPSGTLTSIEYIGADGSSTTNQYDSAGNVIETIVQNTDGSSITSMFAAGIKTKMNVVNADGSQDRYSYGITGYSYTSAIQHLDASGKITAITLLYPDGTLDYTLTTGSDGTTTAIQYNTKGVITGERQRFVDGSSSSTTYVGGVVTKLVVINADHSADYSSLNVTGQSYTTYTQHVDASGKLTSAVRTHADGSLDFTFQTNNDGSTTSTYYNASGVIAGKVTAEANGTTLTNEYDSTGSLLSSSTVTSAGTVTAQAFAQNITLTSGTGNDVFTSFQTDTFVFHAGFGQDSVYGFNAGSGTTHDTLQFDKAEVSDFVHLAMTQSGSDAILTLSPHDAVVLKNVDASTLVTKDFRFV